MRCADTEILFVRVAQQVRFPARGVPQNGVDERSAFRLGQRDGLENCRMLRSFEQEQLIKAEPQKIARIAIETAGTKAIDPEIEQSQVPQNGVEKLRGETAIRRRQIARAQEVRENCVRELFTRAPFLQGDESEAS